MNDESNLTPSTTEDGRVYLSKREVARRLGRTTRTIDTYMQRGVLPYFKVGRAVLFKWQDVESHFHQNFEVIKPVQRKLARRGSSTGSRGV